MSKELAIYNAISNAGQAISSIVQCVKMNKSLRNQDLLFLKEQQDYLHTIFREKATGELVRIGLDEMDKTLARLEYGHYTGEAKDMAAELLQIQHRSLSRLIQRYNFSD